MNIDITMIIDINIYIYIHLFFHLVNLSIYIYIHVCRDRAILSDMHTRMFLHILCDIYTYTHTHRLLVSLGSERPGAAISLNPKIRLVCLVLGIFGHNIPAAYKCPT